MSPDDLFVRINSQGYDYLAHKIAVMDPARDPEGVLQAVQRCAWFAGEFHPGRFADGTVENAALQVGLRLDQLPARPGGYPWPALHAGARRRVLHVVPGTCLGGHTQLLTRWIEGDGSTCHSLLLTAQAGALSGALVEAVRRSGGAVVALPPRLGHCHQAKWLREAARRSADLVIWHLVGPDVVPTAAFAALDLPPLVLVDHADHFFWVGASVADLVVNLRTAAVDHSRTRRFARATHVLPIPLQDPPERPAMGEARRALGIEADRKVLLSVGREVKYRPCGRHDFLATAARILDRHPDAELHVVGATAQGLAPWLRAPLHPRVRLLGRVGDPSLHHAAADIYLESFPFGSQTALLEAALSGLSVVPACAPLFALLVANDDALVDLLPNPPSEEASIERATELIGAAEQRKDFGWQLRERLLREHVGQGWVDRVSLLYRAVGSVHRWQPIPQSPMQAATADIGMSLWHGSHGTPPAYTEGSAQAASFRRALVAKIVGDYSSARRHAFAALRNAPLCTPLWRLLLRAGLGSSGDMLLRACRSS